MVEVEQALQDLRVLVLALQLVQLAQLAADQQLGAAGDALQQAFEAAVLLGLADGGLEGGGAGQVERLAEPGQLVGAAAGVGAVVGAVAAVGAVRAGGDGAGLGLDVHLLAAPEALDHLGQGALHLLGLGVQFLDAAAHRAAEPPGGDDHRDDRDQADDGGQHDPGQQAHDGALADLYDAAGAGLDRLDQLRVELVEGLAPLILGGGEPDGAVGLGGGGLGQLLFDGGLGLPGRAVHQVVPGGGLAVRDVRDDLDGEQVVLCADGLLDGLVVGGAQAAGGPAAGQDGVLAGQHLLRPEGVHQGLGDPGDLAGAPVAERGEQPQVHRDQVGVVGEDGLLVGRSAVHGGALLGELSHGLTGLGDRGAHLVGRVVGGLAGQCLELAHRVVGRLPLAAQLVGVGAGPGERFGAEPALLLEVVVDDVRRLAGLLGQQALGRLLLEVEDGLAAGDRPEDDEGDAGDDGQDEQRRPQGQA